MSGNNGAGYFSGPLNLENNKKMIDPKTINSLVPFCADQHLDATARC
jgi:hypothetical protein